MQATAKKFRISLIRARLLRPRLRVDSSHCIEGVFLLLSPSRHVPVACLVVAILSCAGHADAQNPSRPEALLKKMTLDEKIGQLVQRAGGRSKALNSRLDDAELERVRTCLLYTSPSPRD